MSRWLPLTLLACASCGDNLIATFDAAAPDGGADASIDPPAIVDASTDAAIDPPTCTADTTVDEANCGTCGHACAGGQVCRNSTCSCPTGVVPPLVFPTGTEQFFGAGAFTIALAPTLSLSGINGLAFGFSTSLPKNTNIDLATVPLGSTPFVAAGVGLDIQSFSLDASYVATAGTIRFSKLCATEIQGTLTNATFQGISSGFLGLPTPDPTGCQVHVNAVAFHLMTAPCP